MSPSFQDLALIEPLQRALAEEAYTAPTPIQEQAIPPLLAGRDVLGCAQTGTGKTAAFALPVLQLIAGKPRAPGKRRIRALVLTPTRELAAQISESFSAYGRHLSVSHLVIFGGVGEHPQIRALRAGVDVLVATPGRLLDLHGRGLCDLGGVEFFVLDEADRMLDMGFVNDVRKVLKALPSERQNLLFSATMPPPIMELARSFLHRPIKVEVTPQATTVEAIEQTVMFVDNADKKRLLADLLLRPEVERSIVFTRTKHGANRLAQQLGKRNIDAAAIHGNKSQGQRTRALDGFRRGDLPVLVATDIAARGIDVDGVSHVFNYDLPNEPEVYVHRIGRTGRAGRSGVAVSFCGPTEAGYLRAIEKTIGQTIEMDLDHEYHYAAAMPRPDTKPSTSRPSRAAPKTKPPARRRPPRGKAGAKPAAGGKPAARTGAKPAAGGKPAARTGAKPAARSGTRPAARTGGGAAAGDGAAAGRRRRRRKPKRSS